MGSTSSTLTRVKTNLAPRKLLLFDQAEAPHRLQEFCGRSPPAPEKRRSPEPRFSTYGETQREVADKRREFRHEMGCNVFATT